jgi:hypothetical protein
MILILEVVYPHVRDVDKAVCPCLRLRESLKSSLLDQAKKGLAF